MTEKNKITEEQTPENLTKPSKKRRRGLKIAIVAVLAVIAVASGMLLAHFDVFNRDTELADEMTMEEFFAQEGDSSFDLIEKAYQEEKIDKETKLIYSAYSAFGDERLPAEYQSDVIAYEATRQFAEIQEYYDNFSPENKEIIGPFLKRPNDPDSWWNQQANKQTARENSVIKTVHAASNRPTGWGYVDTNDGKFRVWYANTTDLPIIDPIISYFIVKPRAEYVKNIIDSNNIYARFKKLLKKDPPSDGTLGGDNRIDIYLNTRSNVKYNTLGLARGDSDSNSRYIILSTTQKNVVVHEIFHIFQDAFAADAFSYLKNRTWMEATAVWSEDYIFETYNSEQGRLKYFVPYPERDLDGDRGDLFIYGAYIFPYYITQNFGDDKIREIFEGCKNNNSCMSSVNKNIDGGFKKQWREFTLWNFNEDPVKKYHDPGGFPNISSFDSSSDSFFFLRKEKEEIVSESLSYPPLSAELFKVFNKLDQNTEQKTYKQVKFSDFDEYTSQSDGSALKAIVYPKESESYVEDWTDKKERNFCLENPKENFDYIMLIASNGNMTSDPREEVYGIFTPEITAEAKTQSCYTINQEDQQKAQINVKEINPDMATTSTIGVDVKAKTEGELIEPAKKEVKYGYQGKWEVKTEFTEEWDSYNFYMNPKEKIGLCSIDPVPTVHTITFNFDLTDVSEDSTFSTDFKDVKTTNGSWSGSCTLNGVTVSPQTAPYKWGDIGVGDGIIYDMTEDSAKLKFSDSFAYGDSFSYRTMEPIVIEIKRNDN